MLTCGSSLYCYKRLAQKKNVDPLSSFRTYRRTSGLSGSALLQPHNIHASDDSNNSDESDIDRSHSVVPQEDAIRVDDDVDLASPFLKNMFTATDPPRAPTAPKAPQDDPVPERSFADDSEMVDWDF
jgi:hypothetical protein